MCCLSKDQIRELVCVCVCANVCLKQAKKSIAIVK